MIRIPSSSRTSINCMRYPLHRQRGTPAPAYSPTRSTNNASGFAPWPRLPRRLETVEPAPQHPDGRRANQAQRDKKRPRRWDHWAERSHLGFPSLNLYLDRNRLKHRCRARDPRSPQQTHGRVLITCGASGQDFFSCPKASRRANLDLPIFSPASSVRTRLRLRAPALRCVESACVSRVGPAGPSPPRKRKSFAVNENAQTDSRLIVNSSALVGRVHLQPFLWLASRSAWPSVIVHLLDFIMSGPCQFGD